MPKILLLLPQSPFDASSGAARSMRTMCEMAVKGGFEVMCLCTTAIEHGAHPTQRIPGEFRGVTYTYVSVGTSMGWERDSHGAFDRDLAMTLRLVKPDILLLYGCSRPDVTVGWMRRAKQAGARVIFGLRNLEYRDRTLLDEADALLACSDFTRDYYKRTLGVESTSIPVPIDPDDCIAKDRVPKYVTIVNPSREKGQLFIARFVEQLAAAWPKIPIQIFESRGTDQMLRLASGFDFRGYDYRNVRILPIRSQPHEIFQETRVLVVPSVWEEPAGRVVAEAMLNGVVPIVSERGGLPEMCHGAGLVLPLPDSYTLETTEVLPASAVQPWVDTVVRLYRDEDAYFRESNVAREVGYDKYSYPVLQAKYVEFFRSQLKGCIL